MSYAIIRNAKYKRENLMAVYRHNERKNKHYSNKDIDRTKSHLNYSLKDPEFNYVKEFDKILKKYDLKGQIKTVSNIACEYMITSDNDFFKRIGEEETDRVHYTLKEYKNITNYEQAKETLKNIKLELADVPNITDININRLSKKRDEKILEKIIKPKDDLIQNLYQDNMDLHKELSRQTKVIEEAEKYQKERDRIMSDNANLHNEVEQIKTEYKQKEFNIEWKYKSKIKSLEKENSRLNKIIDKFYETIDKFIYWICKKFDMGAEDNLNGFLL